MKTNCELPNSMLKMNAYLNDYDFVLFHLYSVDKTYREYYQGMRKYRPNRLMILDNSAYEFFVKGDELDVDGYITAIKELKPDMFLLPDVLMSKESTLSGTRDFMNKWNNVKDYPSRPMAVIQGNTPEELIECANEYKKMGIVNIAVPFHNSFFAEYSKNSESEFNNHLRNDWRLHTGAINLDDEYALGRVLFLHDNKDKLNKFQHVHLLGSHQPLEKYYYNENLLSNHFGFIKTMDTGYPVKCAIAGYKLGHEPWKPDVIIDDFLNSELSEATEKLIAFNVQIFKQY